MKSSSHLRFYWLALVVALAGGLVACATTPATVKPAITKIRVVMDNNYPPYVFTNEKGELRGITVDQWKLWEARTGVKVELVGRPWDQALSEMKNGEYDVIDTIFYTDERAQIFDFTKPYADINVNIFFPSGVSGIGNIDSLQGFRVAVKTGDANAEYLQRHGVSNLVFYNSYEEIVKAAAAKKETIFVIDQPPALYFLYKYRIQDSFQSSEPLYGGQFHRAVKKGNASLLALINSGFEKISATEYQQVDERWFGKKYPPADISHILPYLGAGAAVAIFLIALLVFFNRELSTRVASRTRELQTALENLKVSEELFREAIQFLPIPIGIANTAGDILEFNREFTEHYGYTVQDAPTIHDWWLHAYPNPEYRAQVTAQWNADAQEAMRTGSTPLRVYRVTGKDGKQHEIEIIMRVVRNLWVASFVDITERKRAENNLREAETKYRAILENAPEVIYVDHADESSSNTYISPQVTNLLGYAPEDFEKNPLLWHQIVHPQDYQRALASITGTLTLGGTVEEYRMIKSDGTEIWVRDSSIAVYDEHGAVSFIQGFLQDITERKHVEERLKKSEQRYRTLFEDSAIPLLEEDFSEAKKYLDKLSADGVQNLRSYFDANPLETRHCVSLAQVINMNKAAMEWYEVKNKTELPIKLSRLMGMDGYKNFLEELLTLKEGHTHYEFASSRLDHKGRPFHIIVSGTILPSYENTWEHILISIVDITKRKLAEEELEKQLELVRGLRAIDQAIITNLDLNTNLNILLREIITQLRVDAASISLCKNEELEFAVGQGFQTDPQIFAHAIAISGLTKRAARERSEVYILNLQEMDYPATATRAIKAEGFIAYCGMPLIVKDRLLGVLEVFQRARLNKEKDWLTFMEMLAGQAAITINSATLFNDLQTSNANLQLAYDSTLAGWSRALDLRDKETEGHTQRVTELTVKLARKFGLNDEQLLQVKRGSLLHDIGKMGIPDSILLKPAELTDEEWVIMRRHTAYAYEMLSPIQYLQPALDIPLYHHERWDGSGYPHGLKGEKIPLTARIFAVVDNWDALTSNRPYREAWEPDKVKEYLREKAGSRFDPRVVEVFLQMVENNEV